MKAYKYRGIENDCFQRDIDTISTNKFYASSFEMLNDPFEATFNEIISESFKAISDLFSTDATKMIDQLREISDYKSNLGIYSLSKTWSTESMWAYYASSHKGYCIGYDIEKLKDKSRNPDFIEQLDITYCHDMPTVDLVDLRSNSLLNKMFGTKQTSYKHEDETRLIFDRFSLKEHHHSAITDIYFGLRTQDSVKVILYNTFRDRDIAFWQITAPRTKYVLEKSLLTETKRPIERLDTSTYEILATDHMPVVENYHVFLNSNEIDKASLENFIFKFREEFCTKNCNISIYDDKSIKPLIAKYPLAAEEYQKLAEHLVAILDFEMTDILLYPYKNPK